MGTIIQRLSVLEQKIEDIQQQKYHIPVLVVQEESEGIYTYLGTKLNGQVALQKFAEEHGAVTVIIDDIPKEIK